MKRFLMVVLVLLLPACMIFAASALFEQADALYDQEEYIAGFNLLKGALDSAATDAEKAEIYWRLSRFQLYIADDEEDAGAKPSELLAMFDAGSDYADKAIALAPSAEAYYWRSSNTGRWGETKGVLDSLFKAAPMRSDLLKVIQYDPDYADAWYVLGRLYLLLPGWPISFGNISYAASYARRSIEVYAKEDLKISYYKSLAEILWKRNWSAGTRKKELDKRAPKYQSESDTFGKITYFEAAYLQGWSPAYTTKGILDLSDRDEARLIAEWVIGEYDKIKSPKRGDTTNINEVKALMESWD